MNAHEFIFGDRFEQCIVHITNEACRVNTREAFKEAIQKIMGIKMLCHFISGSGGVPMPTAFLLMQNEISNIQKILDTPTGCLPKK